MPKLVLTKHSPPAVDPAGPPSRWKLAPAGMERAARLAAALLRHEIRLLYSSPEPKALQTAMVIEAKLGLECRTRSGLHEHRRANEPFETEERFLERVQEMFQKPDEVVYGEESAHQALERFERAITSIVEEAGGSNAAVVSHGTVMSLFVASKNGLDALALWNRLGLPSFIVLETRGFEVVDVVANIGGQ